MSRVKPAQVRFYFDADILGLAHIIAGLRPDATYPGDPGGIVHKRQRPPSPVTTTKTDDDVWIPLVTERGWLIVTKDRHIQTRPREIQAVREHGARMVSLGGAEAVGTFKQLEIVMSQWRRIEQCLNEPGPFIYIATRTSFRPVDLT
ncbi:hypothetical protein [Actinocorallia libanotica]|uniref:VapC45 PIN like domain-containing protein n=1 Tax=Actinocorallia libanotica TaxID=46162 RepID=A0ABN1RSZ7_9ACTN